MKELLLAISLKKITGRDVVLAYLYQVATVGQEENYICDVDYERVLEEVRTLEKKESNL